MLVKKKYLVVLFLLSLFIACESELTVNSKTESILVLPEGFPELQIEKGSELTEDRVALGKKLFFDPILSGDLSLSCGSCHQPEVAFAENKRFSSGTSGKELKINTPSLANVAYINDLMKEGGVHTLEIQVVAPVETHEEMDLDINDAVKRLQNSPVYVWLSFKSFGKKPDHFVLTRSLAAFERTLISGNSKYDLWKRNEIDFTDLEKEERSFFSRFTGLFILPQRFFIYRSEFSE